MVIPSEIFEHNTGEKISQLESDKNGEESRTSIYLRNFQEQNSSQAAECQEK